MVGISSSKLYTFRYIMKPSGKEVLHQQITSMNLLRSAVPSHQFRNIPFIVMS